MSSELRVFVSVVEKGNFSAAADFLNLTPSAVSKLITRLENRLGARLLNRTTHTRQHVLTPEGEYYYLHVRDILSSIADVETEISRFGQAPRGRLRVNSMTGFAFHELARVFPAFVAKYPEITVEIAVTDRVVDLV